MRVEHALALLVFAVAACHAAGAARRSAVYADSSSSSVHFVSPDEARELREEVRAMFYHGYNGYMRHAFPLDELRPRSCKGEDSLGGYTLTLIDSLDSLALLGNKTEFASAVRWLSAHLNFDKNKTVSLFETNIRVMGGLLSAHLIASDPALGMQVPGYDNELLRLAEDLGRRLLPAFDTPTGIPFGSVNLRHGVLRGESKVTATAGGGTLALEFGVLSRLTGDPVFEDVARNAVRALWARRSSLGLLGAHIDIFTGEWTHKDAGVGTSIDSFYEYLIKAHILFGDYEYLHIFQAAYDAVMTHIFHDPWYVEVNMDVAVVVWPLFNSLQAFWPGLQVMIGDIDRAARSHRAFFSVWRRYGFTPEGFNLAQSAVQPGQTSYPLRPELAESTYWLYKATGDPFYLAVGRDMVASLALTRCRCGYCHVSDVETHALDDHMESFFLSETVKYLYLLFDLALGGDNIMDNGPYQYVLTTEGHLLPLTPEISFPSEHCSYLNSFCAPPQASSCRVQESGTGEGVVGEGAAGEGSEWLGEVEGDEEGEGEGKVGEGEERGGEEWRNGGAAREEGGSTGAAAAAGDATGRADKAEGMEMGMSGDRQKEQEEINPNVEVIAKGKTWVLTRNKGIEKTDSSSTLSGSPSAADPHSSSSDSSSSAAGSGTTSGSASGSGGAIEDDGEEEAEEEEVEEDEDEEEEESEGVMGGQHGKRKGVYDMSEQFDTYRDLQGFCQGISIWRRLGIPGL
ncbi:unnamed protein product [Closterium sp. NIES-54]